MGLDVLFWIVVLTWMTKRGAEDVLYAVKGQTPPRHRERMERIKRGESQARYGARGWLDDATEDFLRANTQWRRSRAAKKAAERLSVPIDDMVDVVREDRHENRPPAFPTGGPLCPVCLVTTVPAGEECPTCTFWKELDEANERREAEWKAGMRPTGDYEEPTCVQCRETPAQPGSARCAGCDRREEAEAEMRKPTNRDDEDELTADDVLNALAGPGGLFAGGVNPPKCSWHQKPMQQVDGQLVCPACIHIVPQQPAATDDRPDARIYQFPTVKTIEEITMATSEVTGLSTALAFAAQTAAVHASFSSAGTENYVAALAQHGVGDGTIGSARDAMEKSAIAAAAWEQHRDDLAAQHTVKEAYQGSPDAGNKEFLLNG
ncbi:hypothetical protein OG989_04000 [Micromonospora sp. NBC_01740]|uniref:hypothetical protein n=1 Tax=Micromonospora sp. NBC_01740 TaxID=2975986 RepID=UPI002E0E1A80|nr:hypothetical protein OG989_04000 [Micromonospora sp. NBC_01740]